MLSMILACSSWVWRPVETRMLLIIDLSLMRLKQLPVRTADAWCNAGAADSSAKRPCGKVSQAIVVLRSRKGSPGLALLWRVVPVTN